MLVLIVAVGTGLLAGYLMGGRLQNLERLPLRLPWLVLLAVAVQLVIFTPLGDGVDESVSLAVHVASYGALLLFFALNLGHKGVAVAGLGAVLNAVVIVANGGYMPATRRALEIAGMAGGAPTDNNSMVAHAGVRLLWLGDVMGVPGGLPVLSNVFSVGDVLIAVGVAILLASSMRSPAPLAATSAAEAR